MVKTIPGNVAQGGTAHRVSVLSTAMTEDPPVRDYCTGCGRPMPDGPAVMHLDAMDPDGPLVLLCAACAQELKP